jgi:hypothetical protein
VVKFKLNFGVFKMFGKMKKLRVAVAGVGLVSLIAAGNAAAAVDAAVSTEMGVIKTDITTVGGLIIALAVTAMGIRWVKATFF